MMKKCEKPKIALFALNGVGSMVLKTLSDCGYDIVGLWTRKEPNPHPYFRIEDVDVLARVRQIPVFFDHEGFAPDQYVDLILSATYDRKIAASHRSHAGLSVNLHQSLLPLYAGRNPFKAVIAAKETESGVTAHHITDEWDGGPTIYQYRCDVNGLDEGQLRSRLGVLTACMAVNIVNNRQTITGEVIQAQMFRERTKYVTSS